MSQLKSAKAATTSEPIANENLANLRRVFPQFVKDGEIDFDALQAFFKKEGILAGGEKYGLNWAGKSNAFKAIRTPATGTLAPQPQESKDWDKTQNLFIEGDNLEVLKLLQKHYRDSIKMIYIDPPYNTGKDFIYKDNFYENVADYYERTGQTKGGIKLTTNTESSGRYHSDWLTMMYPRLFLGRNLLKDDGVMFVSIDDNEVHNLRMIMDEIFGEENFVATIIWQKKYSPQNDATYFSDMHDYVLCYAKTKKSKSSERGGWARNLIARAEEQDARYSNPDDDPRGQWKSADFSVKTYSRAYDYPIKTPAGRIVRPPKGRSWSTSQEKFEELKQDSRIWFGKTGNNVPALKVFLSEVQKGIVPTTIWTYEEVGHNQEGRQELKELFEGEGFFDNPKPVGLLVRILQTATSTDDIILDFFAGSGTTAHAVMAQNAEDGGNRKWICVQLPEETDKDSEARKAGYKTIADISRERIRRAGKKIGKGDIGFKSFKLSPSNYRQWNVLTEKDDEATLKKQMKLIAEKPLVDRYDEQSVVFEVLVKEGFSLNAEVKQEKKGGLEVWSVTDGVPASDGQDRQMFVCFAKSLTQKQVESLALPKDTVFVCLDSALDDSTKVNLARGLNVKVI